MTSLLAAFPMYRRPELQPAFDALWFSTRGLLRAEGIAAPDALTVAEEDLMSFWLRPDLLLGQTAAIHSGIS